MDNWHTWYNDDAMTQDRYGNHIDSFIAHKEERMEDDPFNNPEICKDYEKWCIDSDIQNFEARWGESYRHESPANTGNGKGTECVADEDRADIKPL